MALALVLGHQSSHGRGMARRADCGRRRRRQGLQVRRASFWSTLHPLLVHPFPACVTCDALGEPPVGIAVTPRLAVLARHVLGLAVGGTAGGNAWSVSLGISPKLIMAMKCFRKFLNAFRTFIARRRHLASHDGGACRIAGARVEVG